MSQPPDASLPVPGAAPLAASGEVSSDEIKQLLLDPGLPEPLRRALEGGAALERIELTAEGQWRHQGEAFANPGLIALFHRSIARTAGGTYVLSIPPFTYPITIADTPRFVRHVRLDGAAVTLLLSDGSEQPLQPDTLAYVDGRGLYCRVRAPDGSRWPARFLRPAYYALGEHLGEADGACFLDLPGQRISVPTVEHTAALSG